MARKKPLELTEGPILPALLSFIIPIILTSLIQQFYSVADTIIIGKFTGKEGLAAINSVYMLFKFPINFMNGLAAGTTILISRYYGAKNFNELHSCTHAAEKLSIILGLICSVAGVIAAPGLLHLMQVPDDIYQQALIYCRIYFGGLWSLVLYNMVAGILRAFGDSRRPLYILIFSSVLNIAGDLLLVGVFNMGLQGAAIATIFAQAISAVCIVWILYRSSTLRIAKSFRLGDTSPHHFVHIAKVGLPLALQSILFPIANAYVQAHVNEMGTTCIAAWGICDKMNLLIWLIADAMSPALTTYVAQNIGAHQYGRIKKGVLFGTMLSAGFIIAISLILFFGAGAIGSWFIPAADKAEVIPLVVHYTRMMAGFFWFYALAEAFTGACCGMGDTFRPMLLTLITVCLLRVLCIAFILPIYFNMDCIVAIYISSWVAAGVAFAVMYARKQRKLRTLP